MLILSQDKSEIVNFNEIFRLYIDTWSLKEFATEPDCWCIRAEKASDNMICTFLGEYATEERAKEVLEEIIRKYAEYAEISSLSSGISGIFELPKIYRMPEK